MTVTTGPTAVGFAITVPDSWFELDLHPASRDDSLRRLVYDRVRDQPELREQRPTIVKLLREYARRAADTGAVYSACFVEPTTDGPITGALTISIVDGPADALLDGADPVTALRERLSPQPRRADPLLPWREVVTVELPDHGLVPRSFGIEDLELPNGAPVRAVTMQTFVPLPGSDPTLRLALISATSPVLWLADTLLDLFDAVSSTFRLVEAE